MKRMIFLVFIIGFLLCEGVAQKYHVILQDFTFIKERKKVILTWTIKQGASCIGIGILRSIDDEDYKLIGEIEGICGSSNESITYTFIDEQPNLKGENFYRLTLGLEGTSDPALKVWYPPYTESNAFVSPNPIGPNDTSSLFWPNLNNDVCKVSAYNSLGNLLDQWTVQSDNLVIRPDFLHAKDHISLYPGGNFYFRIVNTVTQEISTASLVVLK